MYERRNDLRQLKRSDDKVNDNWWWLVVCARKGTRCVWWLHRIFGWWCLKSCRVAEVILQRGDLKLHFAGWEFGENGISRGFWRMRGCKMRRDRGLWNGIRNESGALPAPHLVPIPSSQTREHKPHPGNTRPSEKPLHHATRKISRLLRLGIRPREDECVKHSWWTMQSVMVASRGNRFSAPLPRDSVRR